MSHWLIIATGLAYAPAPSTNTSRAAREQR